ncbi:NAD(P)H-binding protein [Paenibacillus sp. SYP-B3998]|uniref:NAD(P)H-binding protein n=1 Tax=Paenibacillus sp. SYP-B3998 TaxID=2678564 RepID=A0A6G3ZZJ2_9BACL|nr:NAD(P)H-binding protein [Paenibacillus sp. SYP-B3998]NEW07525.1 NAD(P)H-binding protein [Paenibacillus sp. SYP-B3998]
MRILLLGATGRVGRRVLNQALAAGHEVQALIRNPKKLENIGSASLFLYEGDVCREDNIVHAVAQAQLVISCLSTDGGTVLTESVPYLIKAMDVYGVRRIVTVGTAGILQSREHHGLLRYESPNSRRSSTRAAEEHRKAWELLAASSLDWTVVCPTYLPDGEPLGNYRVERDYLPEEGMSISVGDTADFTYQEALACQYVKARVGLAY